jgi:glycosyltransferase involved in cell wall biosynthesis
MANMKIGFDISQTGQNKGGCGYFAESLIQSLARIDSENHYILYPTFGDMYWDPDWASGICRIHHPNFKYGKGHKTFEDAKLFWNQPSSDFDSHLKNPDIIHSNNFYCPKTLSRGRLVYTLYDLSFLVYPEFTTEYIRSGCFQGIFEASAHADLIISISHYTRNHFLKTFPHYPPDRIAVIHPASRFSYSTEIVASGNVRSIERDRFWLSVGVLEPRKNHRGLLRAYALLKADLGGTFPLVFAGGKGWLMDDFEKEIDALDLRKDVIMLGYTEDETLQWLYQNCFAFIYPSFFEGFGLPVLEAMSLGAAVVASNVTSIPEIVGNAGMLINPTGENEIYQAMRLLATDPELRFNFKEEARRQASQFSWESAARTILLCYQEVLERGRLF